jgi:hypothetical protein
LHQRIATKERQPIIEAEILHAKRMRKWYFCVYILGIALMIAGYYAMDWQFHFRLFAPKYGVTLGSPHRLIFVTSDLGERRYPILDSDAGRLRARLP